ncbi:calcium-binding protein [Rhizobium sp. Root1220]|uniref:calcium-binding protein n=1 Tax=Rhizobium sp. Root1220 TaxID=1736432 RepID=UPI0006FD6E23|nr:calcium-binding protein [Rhizobium sp. Root1220]KQV84120.1 calcium-binding protein [Rhizobium sp. Root1220]
MSRNKLILAALSSVMFAGAAAGSSFAASGDKPRHPSRPHQMMGGGLGSPIMREVVFVRMLQQFDTNKDGQITKQEAKDGMEAIFAAIDTNNDGSLTPGEIRKYHEAQMAKVKASKEDTTDDESLGQTDDDAMQPAPPPGGPDGGAGRHGMRGGMIRELLLIQRIDTDENGQISQQEADAAFDKFFSFMDNNKDGVISIADMPDRPFP